jgi:hypothetical protein
VVKKEEGRRKKEEGRRKREEGRRKREEGKIVFSTYSHASYSYFAFFILLPFSLDLSLFS